jgi:hypothetical protein
VQSQPILVISLRIFAHMKGKQILLRRAVQQFDDRVVVEQRALCKIVAR